MRKKFSMKKKLKKVLIISIVFVCLLALVLILPFVINLNRFKPEIQEVVSKQVNAKIDFDSIQLTILSGLGFKLENVSLINTDPRFKNTQLIHVKQVTFKTQVLSLLNGKIIGTVFIGSPNINILKDKDLNNVITLVKVVPVVEKKQEQSIPAPESKTQLPENKTQLPENKTQLPENKTQTVDVQNGGNNFVKNILIKSFKIENAKISFQDIGNKKVPILIEKLNLNISNIGVDREKEVIFSTNVDLNEANYNITGPVSLTMKVKTALENSKWKNSEFKGELNLSKLKLNYKDAFVKSQTVPFLMAFSGLVTPNTLTLSHFLLTLQNLGMDGQINIQDFQKLNATIALSLFSKNVASLAEILPKHKQFLSKGNFQLDLNAKGMLSDTNSMTSKIKLVANLANSDISLNATESSLKPLKATLQAQSVTLNLGEMIKPFLTPSPKKEDALFDLRKLKFEHFSLDSTVDNNLVTVKELDLEIFKGSMESHFVANLKPAQPEINGHLNFIHIQLEDLVKVIQFKEQSPIEGMTDLTCDFNGKGITRDVLFKTLNAKGNYLFKSGKLNIKSIIGIASEQLTKYLASVNIPGLSIGTSNLKNIDLGQYAQKSLKNAKGNFEIKNGKLIVDNNITSDQGDMKLNATVGLDESLGGKAVYTSTKSVRDELVSQNKNFAYLLDSKGYLQLNLILGGTITNPDVKIDPTNLANNILHNTTQAMRDKVKEQIKEKIKNNPEAQKIEDAAKKLLKDKGLDLGQFGL